MTVGVTSYDESWPVRYREEAARIVAALGPLVRRIEHVGSTAVPGLAAKPIVDIQISVADRPAMQEAIGTLEAIGYRYEPLPGFEDYPFLGWPGEHPNTFHVHLCFAGSDNEHRHLAVRDLLRRDPVERERYGALKLDLAERLGRTAYAEAKAPFVAALEQRALDAAGRPAAGRKLEGG